MTEVSPATFEAEPWTVINGMVSWGELPRSGALRSWFQDSGVLTAFCGGEPGMEEAEVVFRCAIDDDGRLASTAPDGGLRTGPAYTEFAAALATALDARVDLHDAHADGEPSPPEPDSRGGLPAGNASAGPASGDAVKGAVVESVEDAEELPGEFGAAVPTVIVGKFPLSELVLAASSWGQPLKYLDEGQWRIVLVPDVSALTWQSWDRGSRPVAAFTSFDGFRTVEVWGAAGRRNRPGSDFWHAWTAAAVPAVAMPVPTAPELAAVMAKILAPEVPGTAGFAAGFGLDTEQQTALRNVLARPVDGPVLAAAASVLGFPARAGALAEGSISLDDVAGFQNVPSHPLPRALAETMVIPAEGNSAAARFHRLVLAKPGLLVAGSALSAAAAVALAGTARAAHNRQSDGASAALRTAGLAFAADAVAELLMYRVIRSTRKTQE